MGMDRTPKFTVVGFAVNLVSLENGGMILAEEEDVESMSFSEDGVFERVCRSNMHLLKLQKTTVSQATSSTDEC